MMRTVTATGMMLLAISAGTGFATEPPVQPPVQPTGANLPAPVLDPTPKALVGVWVPVSCMVNGKEEFGENEKKEFRLSIENGMHKLYKLTDPVKMEGVRIHAAKMTVDEKAGTFELEVSESRLKPKVDKIHGIYEVVGNQMKVCYGPADQPRPTKFESGKGSGAFNEVWERATKK
jgi:uncharacterized protein (TIGR03067 family)